MSKPRTPAQRAAKTRGGRGDGDIVRTPKNLDPGTGKRGAKIPGSSASAGGGGTPKRIGPTPIGKRLTRKPPRNA